MNRKFFLLPIALLLAVMLLMNRKVRLVRVLQEQLKVFRNDRTGKISVWDILCFLVFPVAAAVLIVYGLPYTIDEDLAEILTTVYSLMFTILFGFAAVIVEKSESDHGQKRRVIGETFVSIVTSTLVSLLADILSVMLTKVNNAVLVSILSAMVFALSFHMIMLLLMITKRTFAIYFPDE